MGANRATTDPSRLTRNFSKFHFTSPGSTPFRNFVSSPYSGCWSLPRTSPFDISGNVTPNVVEQNSAISSSFPGSWPMNWLQGMPRTTRPSSAYVPYSFSRPAYCGVKPHLEATFTTRTGCPRKSPKDFRVPSFMVRSIPYSSDEDIEAPW